MGKQIPRILNSDGNIMKKLPFASIFDKYTYTYMGRILRVLRM